MSQTEILTSRRDPDSMTRAECLAEVRVLKKTEPEGWKARARKLITRVADIDGIATTRFGTEPAGPRVSEVTDPGPGDDPLAARIRAVMDREKIRPDSPDAEKARKANSMESVPMPGKSARGEDGHIEATVDFDLDAVHIGPGPSEKERKVTESERKLIELEVLARTLGFIEADGGNDAEIVRRVRIVSHYVRPMGTQAELAVKMRLSQPAVSTALMRFKRELARN
jgi:hypothetical protein